MQITTLSTFSEYYEFWKKEQLNSNGIRKDLNGVCKYLFPEAGDIPLEKIDENFLNICIKQLENSNLKNEYKRQIFRLARKSLNAAVTKNLISKNPLGANPFSSVIRWMPPYIYSTAQLKRLMPFIEKSEFVNLFKFVLNTGVKKSEVEKLAWSDIDFEKRKIRIDNREIYMVEGARVCLLKELKKAYLKNSEYESDFDLVFLDEGGNPAMFRLNAECNRISTESNISPFSLKELRDFYIVSALKNGSDVVNVGNQVGINSVEGMKRYLPFAKHSLTNTVTNNISSKKRIEDLYEKYILPMEILNEK